MGGANSHCSSEGKRTGGCKLKLIRSVVTGEHDLDTTVLLPIKVVFYALAIVLVLLVIGRQIAQYRAKKRQAVTMKGLALERFADGDVEKALSQAVKFGATLSR